MSRESRHCFKGVTEADFLNLRPDIRKFLNCANKLTDYHQVLVHTSIRPLALATVGYQILYKVLRQIYANSERLMIDASKSIIHLHE